MEDGEFKKSPAIDKIINVIHQIFQILLLSLAMFSPVATDIESEISQRIARLELFFEYHYSDPHFKDFVLVNLHLKSL